MELCLSLRSLPIQTAQADSTGGGTTDFTAIGALKWNPELSGVGENVTLAPVDEWSRDLETAVCVEVSQGLAGIDKPGGTVWVWGAGMDSKDD